MLTEKYDVIVVGTGFASTFFLLSYLRKAKQNERILVLERGFLDTHAWQLENETTSRFNDQETYVNNNPEKEWQFSIGFGGGSNCWWANTPRFLPSDFELRSRYGVGRDWPITYNDLEPYYLDAERVMAISGPDDGSPYPRSGPYPHPPHRFTDPDRVLKAAYPNQFFNVPTARARIATDHRPRCCATGVCYLCPVDAKFTIQNEMQAVYADERITLEFGAMVQSVDIAGKVARGVSFRRAEELVTIQADLVVLGANGLFNPHILMRSGLAHPVLGRRLNEQVGLSLTVDLAGLDNYQGSTSGTGLAYMEYDGPHRSQRAAFLCLTSNSLQIDDALRLESGRWRQRLLFGVVLEDLPQETNFVAVNESDPDMPETSYEGFSDYTKRSIEELPNILPRLLQPLPVESFTIGGILKSGAHIQGTTVMGDDPADSVIDRNLVHHDVRNLLVLGSGAFPTCPPPMPTLTLSALSLWAADHI